MIGLSFLYFFLPLFMALYLPSPKAVKRRLTLLAAIGLICWAEPLGLILMAVCVLSGYLFGIFIFNFRERPVSKALLGLEIAINAAALLLFHKAVYDGSDLLTVMGQGSLIKNTAAIGASVMPLHSIAYCSDVYKKKYRCDHKFINVAEYIAFFPTFAAGPILSYNRLRREMEDPKAGFESCASGIRQLMIGMFMKLFISNTMLELWQDVREIPVKSLTAPSAWIGIAAFGFFAYFEVKAYVNIAGGLAGLMGIRLPQNTRETFKSGSFTELIRRLNFTLYRWCRDHVYRNIMGDKEGGIPEFFAIIAAVLSAALWYGTALRSVIFAAALIFMLCIDTLLEKPLKKLPITLRSIFYIFLLLLTLPFMAISDPAEAFSYLTAMFGMSRVAVDTASEYLVRSYFWHLVICLMISGGAFGFFLKKKILGNEYLQTMIQPVWVIVLLIFCTAFLVSGDRQLHMYMF